ncbi:MAG TPA: SGNH/GDSL hydrolase family protein [Candidatus Binatia bacterium]|nr:SGNH/GDSL hydrolase family protein [Candidatus Binatia bacterium]
MQQERRLHKTRAVAALMKRKKQALWQNVLLAAGGLLFAFCLIEITVRLVYPQGDYFSTFDPVIGYTHVPGMHGRPMLPGSFDPAVTMNSYGFYDHEYSRQKPNGTVRIAVLGDSYTEALQVSLQDTFHKLLELKLTNATGKKVEVLSFGVGGFGTCDEYLVWQAYAKQFDPDIVIVAFLTLNDISDNANSFVTNTARPRCYLASDGSVAFVPPQEPLKNKLLRPIYRRSHAARLGFKMLKILAAARATHGEDCVAQRSAMMSIYYDEDTEENAYGWRVTERLLTDLRDEVAREGREFYVVSLANPEQTDRAVWEEQFAQCPALKDKANDIFRPDKRLKDIATRNGIALLQLAPIFQREYEDKGVAMHLPMDRHWNAAGHRLAADQMGAWLLDVSPALKQAAHQR